MPIGKKSRKSLRLLKTATLLAFAALNALAVAGMAACAASEWVPPQFFRHTSWLGLLFPVFLAANAAFVVFWLIFKWKCVAIPLAGLLLCAPAVRAYFPLNIPEDTPEGTLKVLSYNVMNFGNNEETLDSAMHYLRDSGADVICLQETTHARAEQRLRDLADIYPHFFFEIDHGNYTAVLSKFPLERCGHIDYNSFINSTHTYRLQVRERSVWLVNNHLESYALNTNDKGSYTSILRNYRHPRRNDTEIKATRLINKLNIRDAVRGAQADSVAAFVERRPGETVIVCGDFNSTPVSYVHHRLTQSLNDAYTRSGNGPGISYRLNRMYFRLDHILVTPDITPFNARVDRTVKFSDHYPISAELKID